MNPRTALKVVFAVSLCGVAFSGTLTYREVFAHTAAACPSPGASGTILGYPACVYGLFMYLVLLIVSGAGLLGSRSPVRGGGASVMPAPR